MVKLKEIPSRRELVGFYGNPENQSFRTDKLDVFRLPYPMRLSWAKSKKATKILAHNKVGFVIIDALKEIENCRGYDYLYTNNFDLLGGVYCFRKIRGGKELSTHSWGISIDINPHLGPCDWKSYKEGNYKDNQPDFIKEAFTKRGFINLPWDTMHFQAMGR